MKASDKVEKKNFAYGSEFDGQIYDSLHDEIIVWLYNQLIDFDSTTIKSLEKASGFKFVKNNYYSDPIIEHVLFSKDKFRRPIGFADMFQYFQSEKIYDQESESYVSESKSIYFEAKTKVNLGDTVRQINYYTGNSSEFQSFYKKRPYKWVVVSSDDRYRKILKSQGIGFIKYNG